MAFPLDGKFAELRAVVEDARVAFVAFTAELRKASGTSSGAGSPGAGSPGGGGGGKSAFADFAKGAREAVRTVGELEKAAKAGGGLAKMLGLPEAEAGLNKVANGLGKAKAGAEGLAAVAKTIMVAWKPVLLIGAAVAVSFGAVVAAGAVAQEAIFALTGQMTTVGGAVVATLASVVRGITIAVAFVLEQIPMIGLAFEVLPNVIHAVMKNINDLIFTAFRAMLQTMLDLVKELPDSLVPAGLIEGLEAAIGKVDVALNVVRGSVRGITREQIALVEQAQRQILATEEAGRAAVQALDEVIFEALDNPGGTRFFENPMKAVEELIEQIGEGVPESVKKMLRSLGEGLSDGLGGGGATIPFSRPLENAAHTTGVEFMSGLLEEVRRGAPQVNEALFQALTVDPDDESKIINSFSDLWKNIKNIFRENPLAIFGLFGSESGLGGRVGSLGMATGGKVPVRGYATGGHIAASDTVPAMLTPGEYVHPVRAVQAYGANFMEAIRQVRIPPAMLHNLVGGYSALVNGFNVPRGVHHGSIRGYADGGPVAGMAGGGGGAGPQVLPVAFVDQANAGMIVRGGRNALLELFATDPAFRQALA